ncbi:uncharacterized protein LOC142894154 [Nelusetta ayraudi]|uniref:uncharacterized protein LOC142894154 n=1 Tax=Nelusetta ayraudi TaxID=303726 RepID=UPI003F71C419
MVKAGILFLTALAVTVCLTPPVWTSDEGVSHVIGSVLPIFAAPGNNVILPCQLEPPLNVDEQTIEWSRPDQQPSPSDHLSQLQYVHVHRQHHEVLDMKSHSYVSRTSLFDNELKHGNISLKIENVTVEDEGQYKCFVPKLRGPVKEAFVRLFVEPTPVKTTETWIHPTEYSTTGPVEKEIKGVQSHHIVLIVVSLVFLLLGGGYIIKRSLTVRNFRQLLERDFLCSRWNKLRCVKTSGFPHEQEYLSTLHQVQSMAQM